MSMDDVFYWTRVMNFVWAFGLFMLFIRWGIIDWMLSRKCTHVHVAPEFYLWIIACFGATVAVIVGSAEQVLQDVSGGIRIFVAWTLLVPASLALRQGIARVKAHRIDVEKGLCG